MKLSIIIPARNEKKTILNVVSKVKKVRLKDVKKEIIIVDNASTDGTKEILRKIKDSSIKIFYHKKDMGKGSAVRTALNHVTGDIVLIQDADLEYNPEEYASLIKPIIEEKANVVYGSRLLRGRSEYARLAYYVAGNSLTILTNFLYGTKITDESSGYKVFKSDIIKNINLKCRRFEFDPEITAKILKKGIKVYEVPISYKPRTRKQGKKIKFRDWLEAVYTLIKYRFMD